MSSTQVVISVGEGARASDGQKMANVAASADDRALEILLTPGSVQKRIKPLGEPSSTVEPALLIVGKDTDGTLANGKVRVRAAHFIAGLLNDPNQIDLAAKLDAALDSAVFGNNSSGSTRTDLVYASISRGTLTQVNVRQKPLGGGMPVPTLLTTATDLLVTVNIVAGVSSVTPLASLPADSAGVYNFGLAAVALVNGYAGGAVNQASITPLWTRAFPSAGRGLQPGTIYSSGVSEKPTTPFRGDNADRWGGLHPVFFGFIFKTTSTTFILDASRDYRGRYCLGGALMRTPGGAGGITAPFPAPESITSAVGSGGSPWATQLLPGLSHPTAASTVTNASLNAGVVLFAFTVDVAGVLKLTVTGGAPTDGTNGDNYVGHLFFSDKFSTT